MQQEKIILAKQNQIRFKDAPWFLGEEKLNITIGGAGGTGSWIALLLARVGYSPNIIDFDTVEEVNMAGQFYSSNQVGMDKVLAVSKNIEDFTDTIISFSKEKITEDSTEYISPILVSAFDNMSARKILFRKWYKKYFKDGVPSKYTPIFIDPRLTAESMQLFCVTKDSCKEYYQKHLFEDSEVEDLQCTYKQTTHAATMIASITTSYIVNHVSNCVSGFDIRSVEFFTEVYLPTFKYNI